MTLRNLDSGQIFSAESSGDGVFRILNLPPGRYGLHAEREGFQPVEQTDIVLNAGDVFAGEFALQPVPAGLPRPTPQEPPSQPPYRTLRRPISGLSPSAVRLLQVIPPRDRVFTPLPDRWKFDWPDYKRYGPPQG